MEIMRRLGWVLIGAMLGSLGTGALAARHAPSAQRPETRLEIVGAPAPAKTGNFVFIRDSKTGGCWLGVMRTTQEGVVSVAEAPNASCR
jgi:hypothetical protein